MAVGVLHGLATLERTEPSRSCAAVKARPMIAPGAVHEGPHFCRMTVTGDRSEMARKLEEGGDSGMMCSMDRGALWVSAHKRRLVPVRSHSSQLVADTAEVARKVVLLRLAAVAAMKTVDVAHGLGLKADAVHDHCGGDPSSEM